MCPIKLRNIKKIRLCCLIGLGLLFLYPLTIMAEQKILDLGSLEIQGEVRRPNVELVYKKQKYFDKALSTIAKGELRSFEQELLEPTSEGVKKPK